MADTEHYFDAAAEVAETELKKLLTEISEEEIDGIRQLFQWWSHYCPSAGHKRLYRKLKAALKAYNAAENLSLGG